MRWSRGYSSAMSLIHVTILLHPWMQPTLNHHNQRVDVLQTVLVCMYKSLRRQGMASGDIRFHRFLIVGPWLASQGCCRSGMWNSLVEKAVSKSVEASKWRIVDPGI